MKLYVGTSGYSYKEWKGKFYPSGLPATKMLQHYGKLFQAVEINSTFRAAPKPPVLETWATQVPAKFKFAFKAPQRITHIHRLKDTEQLLQSFFEITGKLGARLGPLLFQLPPNFKKDLPRLQGFLDLLPTKCDAAFEFRHQSWFEDDVFDVLRAHRAALCLSDEVDALKVPFVATTKWGYLRLRKCKYSHARLKQTLKSVKQQNWSHAYVFFKHEDEATGPILAKTLLKLAT